MKKSKKIALAVIASVVVIGIIVGVCVYAFNKEDYGVDKQAEVVLITNGSNVEDDYKTNGLWNGVKEYADENELECNYLIPTIEEGKSLTTDLIGKNIEIAVNNGAKYIVLPDESFAVAAYEIASTYQDVNFLLIDAFPHSEGSKDMRTLKNVYPVKFDYIEAGFLAGYSLALDGYTNFGFIGSGFDESTGNFAGGFEQGIDAYATENSTQMTLNYGEYDSLSLDFDYSIDAKPVYEPISADAHKLTVVNGVGSGYYKQGQAVTLTANDGGKGKVFDYWQVSDNSATISDNHDKDKASLTMGSNDVTITAIYKNAQTQEVVVNDMNGKVYKTLNVPNDSVVTIEAPKNSLFYDFDHWESSFADAIDDKYSSKINVTVKDKRIVLSPKFNIVEKQIFNVSVIDGMGTGSYNANDTVNLVANEPSEGMMFTKWEITDNTGLPLSLDVDLTNPNLYFAMPNRYNTLAQKFYNDGVEVIFTNESDIKDGIFDAANATGAKVYTISGNDRDKEGIAGYVDFDYKLAVKKAFNDFEGGSIFNANVKSKCIKLSNKSAEAKILNEKGKEIANDKYDDSYSLVYARVADKAYTLIPMQTGADIAMIKHSNNIDIHFWSVVRQSQ